jgi:uncharacterized membrane protein YdjX (TVP38/TMEM64 family)
MSEPTAPRSPRSLLLKLAVLTAAGLGGALLLARGIDLKALVAQGLEAIRGLGPAAYYACMALVPMLPVPFLAFLLPVVSLFGERLGTPVAVALGLLAATTNMSLTYALARWGLRPPLEKLMARLGYKVPQVESGDETDLIIIMRVTPGIPFCFQHYLLGLARVSFVRYLLVSCAASWPQAVGFMLFGDALLHGKGRLALISLSLLLALAAGTHFVRRHYARKKAAP